MNIYLVKKNGNIHTLAARGDNILEVYQDGDRLQYFLFTPLKRIIKELYPQIKKEAFVEIFNCTDCQDKTFFCSREGEIITVYSGSVTNNGEPESLCRFNYDSDDIRITAFILSDKHVLIQKAEPLINASDQYVGRIRFDLTMFDVETQSQYPVTEETYINNGISMIKRISEKDIMLKTGFNCIEDDRILTGSEEDSLIEGIYCGDIDLFIENLKNNSTMHDLKFFVSTYNDKYIISPGCSDNILFYTIVEADKTHSETFFHKILTEEKISFRNDRPIKDDTDIAFVVDGIPYIKINNENSVDFLNLRSADIDISFPDEEFVALLGRLFIMKRIKYNHNHLRFYYFPKLKMVLDEKAEYAGSCRLGDNYYIYI